MQTRRSRSPSAWPRSFANTAISSLCRENTSRASACCSCVNLGLVYLGSRLISDAEDFPVATGLFFAFLITLLTTLFDRYRRVYEVRFGSATPDV